MNSKSKHNSCCPPTTLKHKLTSLATPVTTRGHIGFDLCEIPGGKALVGTDHPVIPLDEESPCRNQAIQPFKMMQTAVTNAMFNEFIEDTHYTTDAQRFGWSFVFYQQLSGENRTTLSPIHSNWWRKVDGACWNQVNGVETDSELSDDHPVVHVSWNDAKAYADWAGGRLPSEAEWEHAARGGLGDILFPWGNQEPDDTHFHPCNIWQGDFPNLNTNADGYATTAPAKSFKPNQYGLFNMCGNVWEWTSGRFKLTGRSAESKQHAKFFKGTKILKGGSYLCHKSYCFRYRIAARTGSTPDSTTSHQGFRLVFERGDKSCF